MKEITEGKEPQKLERKIIQLDQPFHPFDPTEALIKRYKKHPSFDDLISFITLDLDVLKLPFDVSLSTHGVGRIEVITPFDPELGYNISSEDLNLDTRKTKVERIAGEWYMRGEEELDFLNAPLRLSIKTEQEFRFNQKEKDLLAEEVPHFSRGIRVLAHFGQAGSFASKPWDKILAEEGILWFNEFYPQDTGALPPANERFSVINEGFNICLPNDLEKLKQIQVQFVLTPEETQDVPPASKVDPETSSG